MKETQTKENIWNIPNSLTISRILLTFIAIYFIFADFSIEYIAVVFVVGMLTDALDGQIARRFEMKTEFGRKADMIADRFLIIGVAVSFLLKFSFLGLLDRNHITQIFLILIREIIAFPFALLMFVSGKEFPHPKPLAKAVTVMQAITFPTIILGVHYPFFKFSIYLAILTAIIGTFSAFAFIKYVLSKDKN